MNSLKKRANITLSSLSSVLPKYTVMEKDPTKEIYLGD